MKQRIVLAGGSGFLGDLLAKRFAARGWEVIILTRSPQPATWAVQHVQWDGVTLGDWTRVLEGATAVVNLAGRSVDCRYTAENRREILQSRILPTQVIGQAIQHCAQPPRVWLNSSTATIYKHSFDKPMDENSEMAGTPDAKDEFSVEVAMDWEQVFDSARTPKTRKVALRTSMVFSPRQGTVFQVLRRLVKLGLGGTLAGGEQYVAWIHEEDFCRVVEWLIAHEDFSGGVNVAAPNPLPNREMMRTFRRVCGMPFGLPATRWMLEVGAFFMRTETELIIKSRRVIPARLLQAGFRFNYPQLEDAIREIENRVTETK